MNKQQLAAKIWASANKMRSKIEANEYKDYILGFIFYKFLSDKEVRFLKENDYTDEYIKEVANEEDSETVELCQSRIGYFISYENLFSTSVFSLFCFKTIIIVGIPVPKKMFAGSPIIVSILFFSMRFFLISPSSPPRNKTP